jgi:serine/threonine protein kinase/DNA-binding SARP family transcriptional activator/WD40 repeat protein
MLIARVGRVVTNDELIDGIWGDDPPDGVGKSVHTYVSNLRTAIDHPIERHGAGYLVSADPNDVDAAVFEAALDAGRRHLVADPLAASDRLREALALWRGRAYADVDDYPGVRAEAHRLSDLRVSAVETRLQADLALGRHWAVVGELEAFATEHPFRESIRAMHMLALYRDGRQAEALRAYRQTERLLREDLGVDPSPELQEMESRILNHDYTLIHSGEVISERLALLFTGIVGSNLMLETISKPMRDALARHDELIYRAIASAGGTVVRALGDGFIAAFAETGLAVRAAVAAQQEIANQDWGSPEITVRMAVDSGELERRGGDVFGPAMSRGSRLLTVAHGRQILLSGDAFQQIRTDPGTRIKSLGEYRFRGLGAPLEIYQLIVDGLPKDFPALRVAESPVELSGTFGGSIRGYELREPIGKGPLATVYRGFQPSVGRQVAVKVFPPEYANHPAFVRCFVGETRLIASLEHPHIVSVYDFWRGADGAYVIYPILNGRSLADAKPEPLPVEQAMKLTSELGSALSYAHRQGVTHCNIKPSNILLDDDANAYLADFGSAVPAVKAATGAVSASAAYRAPEDHAGEKMGVLSDIYSLAAVVAHLLTGDEPPDLDLSRIDPGLAHALNRGLAPNPQDRPETVDQFLELLTASPGGSSGRRLSVSFRNPYKGLAAFDEIDAPDFFGRAEDIEQLVTMVAEHRLSAVVGPSGSGKSSVTLAGLLPALARGAIPGSESWVSVRSVPGASPFDELAMSLSGVSTQPVPELVAGLSLPDGKGLLNVTKRIAQELDSEVILIVDQFEEIFTLVASAEERNLFISTLVAATAGPSSRLRVVLTLRADFFHEVLSHQALGPVIGATHLALAPLGVEGIRQAIVDPAVRVGLRVEPGLVNRIVADLSDQPGSLPLLQFTLDRLADGAADGCITNGDYHALGGVTGALAEQAEQAYQSLDETQQKVAEPIFTRLLTVLDDAHDVRRRVRVSELRSLGLNPSAVDTVLDRFGRERLLTFDIDPITRGATVEVAHEALLREWPTLRRWVNTRRESLLLQRRFQTAFSEWEDSARNPDTLLTGGRLSQYEEWASGEGVTLTVAERDFLDTSIARRKDEEAQRRTQRHRILGGVAMAACVALVLAVVALVLREQAEAEARNATALRLAGDSRLSLTEDPERSILLALEAAYLSRGAGEPLPPETVSSLHEAVQTSRLELVIDEGYGVVEASPDGKLLVVDAGDHFGVWDAATGTRVALIEGEPTWRAVSALFSPDGSRLAVSYLESADDGDLVGHVSIRDSSTWQEVRRFGQGLIFLSDWSPDGSLLAGDSQPLISEEPRGAVWDTITGEELGMIGRPLVFMDDETVVVDELEGDRVLYVEVRSGEEIVGFEAAVDTFAHFGTELVVASERGLEKWDLVSRSRLWASEEGGWALAISPDTGMVASAGFEGDVWLHAPDDGSIVATLRGHTGVVRGGDFSPDGERLATAQQDGGTRVWDVTPDGPPEVGALAIDLPYGLLLSSDADTMSASLLVSPEGVGAMTSSAPLESVFVYADLETGEPYWSIDLWDYWEFPAAVSADWTTVALVDSSGEAWVHDLVTGARRSQLPVCSSPRAISPDGSTLLVSGVDLTQVGPCVPSDAERRTRVIDAESGDELLDLGSRDAFRAVFNPGGVLEPGRYLIVTGREIGVAPRPVDIFDVVTGDLIGTYTPGTDTTLDLRFDPTGRYLVGGTQNGRAFVVDLAAIVDGVAVEEALVFDQVVGSGGVVGVRLNTDGVLATSAQGAVRLWDVKTQELLVNLAVEIDLPPISAFSPDGHTLYYADSDYGGGVLRKFHLDLEVLIEVAESRVTRDLIDTAE